MIPIRKEVANEHLPEVIRNWLHGDGQRLGLITSIDGLQLISLLLKEADGTAELLVSPLSQKRYHALTEFIPQAHWYERCLSDLFGITPIGHPRLKPAVINEAYKGPDAPLAMSSGLTVAGLPRERDHSYMKVAGSGIYELPVGPVHAGIIEPGHFRLSCLGETIVNLEIRLGFLHRGLEKRLAETPWRQSGLVAEAACSDCAAAYALANAVAIESLSAVDAAVPARAQYLRALALEVERLAMHIGDVGGMAVDLGFAAMAAMLSRLRGSALALAELLSGSRYLRGFICPGGVASDPDRQLSQFSKVTKQLRQDILPLLKLFTEDVGIYERLYGTGCLSSSLAKEFGMVGIAARASNIAYDARSAFVHAVFPQLSPVVCTEKQGDALARTMVRIAEIKTSLDLIEQLLDKLPGGDTCIALPAGLPAEAVGAAVVESFRGELIHLIFTDKQGQILRYAIKDPSFNNWTGLAIAVRNNVIADFPVCNKSFSLSYSGHDL